MFRLDGRVALVTGAARGLGFALSAGLAEAGARVWLNGRDPVALDRAASRIPGARVAPFDVTDAVAADAAIAGILAESGRLDILVNNVGQRDRRPVEQLDRAAFARLLEIDLVAPYGLARAAAVPMRKAGKGRIVNIVSIAGPVARAGDAAYTAAKGGLAALTRALAAEFGRDGITVNGVAPGFFATEANAAMRGDPAITGFLDRRCMLGRWGEPGEIAGAAVFLASDAASYVTGHVLTVDGGMTVMM